MPVFNLSVTVPATSLSPISDIVSHPRGSGVSFAGHTGGLATRRIDRLSHITLKRLGALHCVSRHFFSLVHRWSSGCRRALAHSFFEFNASPAPIINSGSGKPRTIRITGTAMAVPAAIACIGFSLACCFSESIQLAVLELMKSDTSDLMCCGETLLWMSAAVSVICNLN